MLNKRNKKKNFKNLDKNILKKMNELVHNSITIQNQKYIDNYDKIDENIEDILSKIAYDKRI